MRLRLLYMLFGLMLSGIGTASAQAPGVINSFDAVCDPSFPTRCIQPNTDGSIDITGTISATNPSVAATGAAVPASGTYIAGNKAGLLTGLLVDGAGSLNVNIVSGAGSGGTALIDDAAFVAAVGLGTPAMGFVTTDDVDSGDVGVVGMTDDRAMHVNIRDNAGAEVTGWAVTQSGTWNITNVSGTVSLPTGAATEATLAGVLTSANFAAAFGTAGTADSQVMSVQGIASMTPLVVGDGSGALNVIVDSGTLIATQVTAASLNATVVGTGTFAVQAAQSGTWNITNISGTVSLPTGASTAAKQPALGTAGTASTDVITVQGIALMTPLLVGDGVGAFNVIVDSGTLTAVTSITNAVTVTDGAGSLNVIVDSGTVTTVNALTGGSTAHDAAALAVNPLLVGGYASAAAPTDVSLDNDAVRAWYLRNGAQATVLTAAGALIGGDATNGLDVDVTRMAALVAGSANIGDVDVLTVPADPFGANADAASATGSISAKLRFIASTGIPITGTVTVSGTVTANAGSGTFAISAASLPLPTGAATEASLVKLTLTQGSTTSGQSGVLTQGAVTTAAPSYTTAQTNPLSLTTAGSLRVECMAGCAGSGGTSSTFAATFPLTGTAAGFLDSTGLLMAAGSVDALNNLNVKVNVALPAGTNAIGKLSANSGVDIGDVDVTSAVITIFPDNEPFNVAQMNGVAVTMGNGASGTGVQRVTIANDSTGILAGVTTVTTVTTLTGVTNFAPATGAAALLKAEDVAAVSADAGVGAMAIQLATPANTATDGDYAFLQMNAGRLWTSATIDAALPAGTNAIGKLAANSGVDIGDVDVLSIAAGDNNIGNVDIVTLPSVMVGTFPDNEPFNVAQINGVAPLMGNGVTGTGSQRVTIASDNTAFTVNVGTFPDNEPLNVAQINGVTPLMGAGNTGTGSPRVTVATDQAALPTWGHGATAAAVPANGVLQGYRSDGTLAAGTAALTAPIVCQDSVVISTATSGNVELVALTASETVYVCGWDVIATGTVAVQLIYGTGTACATGETNLTGAYPLVANSGLVRDNDFAFTKGAVSNALCIELSAAIQVDGIMHYTKF